MGDGALSRRALLAGAGLAAGAAGASSLGPIMQAGAVAAVAKPPPVPVVKGGAVTADATVSSLVAHRSLRMSGFDFWPDQTEDGRFVSASGTFTSVSDGDIEALVRLPIGAKPTSATWKVLNTAGTTAVVVYQVGWPFVVLSSAGFASVGASPGLQTITTALTATPADPNLYLVRMPTLKNGTRALYTVELFYDDPNVALKLLAAQVRKLDTRRPGALHGKFTPGVTKPLLVGPEVPSNSAAALLNITVTNTAGVGFLTLYPFGKPNPGTSSINWSSSGQTIANSATIAVSPGSHINIFCNGFGNADVVIDLVGYYA